MFEHFILCRSCGILIPIDDSLDSSMDPEAPSTEEELRIFRTAHAGHSLEPARRLPVPAIHDRLPWDPMATAWFRVEAGDEELVVRSSRESIAEPRRHQVSPAPPRLLDCRVEVDEGLLRRAVDRHFYPHVLPTRKLDRFVDIVRETVGHLVGEDIETSFDDVEFPNAGIAPFPPELCDSILSACVDVFDPGELELISSFVEEHRLEDGALAVRVRRDLMDASA